MIRLGHKKEITLKRTNYLISIVKLKLFGGLKTVIGIIPLEFTIENEQPAQLEGDMSAEEATWATIAKLAHELAIEVMKFNKLRCYG